MGLSDILDSLPNKHEGPNLIQLGCIKIGGKSTQAKTSRGGNTWYAPVKYDSFHITTMNRNATGHLIDDKVLMDELTKRPGCADSEGRLCAIPIRLRPSRGGIVPFGFNKGRW